MKTTIKLSKVINAFSANDKGKSIIIHVFDSIKNFKRKVALKNHYKEVKETYELFIKERQGLIDSLLNPWLEKTNKDAKKKLSIEDFPVLPPVLMPKFTIAINKLIETEVDFKPFKFTEKEIEESGITISEMVLIEDFYG